MRTVTRLLGIGWFVAICIVGGVWGGVWLDGKLGSSPLFLLIGLLLGLVIAGVGMYRLLMAVLSTEGK
jgi:F0F1-type ATP synthase assembly protein I